MLTLWDLFQKGGFVMYPLVVCSVISVAIFIERMLLYHDAIAVDAGEVERYYNGLPKDDKNKVQALETKVNVIMGAYEEKISFLSIIITLAPLLGLLGTILGMISSFKVFDLSASQPFAITAGIGEALIATAFGLIVAIFTLLLYGVLKYNISLLNKRLELVCLQLLSEEK